MATSAEPLVTEPIGLYSKPKFLQRRGPGPSNNGKGARAGRNYYVSSDGIKSVLCHDAGVDPAEVDRLISEVGRDESGRVAFSEFRELMNKLLNESQKPELSPDGKTKADQLAQYLAICRDLNGSGQGRGGNLANAWLESATPRNRFPGSALDAYPPGRIEGNGLARSVQAFKAYTTGSPRAFPALFRKQGPGASPPP